MIDKPKHIDTSDYFRNYVQIATGEDLLSSLKSGMDQLLELCSAVMEERSDYRYAPGKWTIKQLVQHLIDTERVFSYRALSFARKDCTKLPGFDEDLFAENDFSDERTFDEILNEYALVRKSTIALFGSFSKSVLDFQGEANGNSFTPRILGWILVGHEEHHVNILQERYLS